MGDFTGFTFGGQHSDGLNIIRVSSGDRYEEQLHPEIKDRTAEVLGVHGDYYFGSDYGTRTFDIDFAFDHLTERQFRELRKIFGTKNIKELIFDERPYKKYMAKIESPVELSYVCFDEPKRTVGAERDGVRVVDRTTSTSTEEIDGEEVEITTTTITRERVTPYEYDYSQTERIYKGEGKISFICHFPFAKSVFKELPEGSEEWAISSGILSATTRTGQKIDEYDNGQIIVYNPGDIETGFRLYCPSSAAGNSIVLQYGESDERVLVINAVTLKVNGKINNQDVYDDGFIIDTNSGLINGVKSISTDLNGNTIITTSDNIYNEYVNSGYFFHLPSSTATAALNITGGVEGMQIFYDYLYF